MSAPLGFFSEDEVRDYPDLNKCPDCETFFDGMYCPLCGKECPEEMRAGNRKPVKVKKHRRSSGSGRVQFVPWYLSTWFIIMMLFVQPIIGLILTWMGYWQKHWKVIATVLVVLSYVGTALFGGLMGVFGMIFNKEDPLVNTELTQSEYIERCQTIDAEVLYREANQHRGEYVELTLLINNIVTDFYDYESDYTIYYQCSVENDGRTWNFLVRDVRQGNQINLAAGDEITVYGEVAGNVTISDYNAGDINAPCINMLYVIIQ